MKFMSSPKKVITLMAESGIKSGFVSSNERARQPYGRKSEPINVIIFPIRARYIFKINYAEGWKKSIFGLALVFRNN